VKRSTEWAICAAILFSASIVITVAGLLLTAGGGLLTVVFLLMGVGALLASNRFRKLERPPPVPSDVVTDAHELPSRNPQVQHDRAFNRLAMARREAEILATSGVDVNSARSLIDAAQGAFDTGAFERAYESAQSAHELLVAARPHRPMPSHR